MDSNKIDVTMTATLRPGIVEQTLKSFCKKVFKEKDRFRLIVNVDCAGESGASPNEIIEMCNGFFGEVDYRIAKTPSFPLAVLWTWSRVKSKMFFHLEDDWIIERNIDFDEMISELEVRECVASLRMCKWHIPNTLRPVLFDQKWEVDGKVLLSTKSETAFGLNPSLIRRQYIEDSLPRLAGNLNPEKQFRGWNPQMRDVVMKWRYGIYGSPGDTPLVRDIGREWIAKSKFFKPNAEFVSWDTTGG